MYEWPKEADQPAEVQRIIASIKEAIPGMNWTRAWVKHPGNDDDGLWYFWIPDQPGEVQIESSYGVCPFLVETDKHDERFTGKTIKEVAEKTVAWLALPGGSFESFWHPR
jgi:hypothetical protein